jgi:hypothetical protein
MSDADQSTRETTRRVLIAHGVPPALLDSPTSSGSPFRLLSWGMPDFQRASALESLAPGLAGICPFVEEDAATILLQFEEACLRDGFDEAARILDFRQVDELRRLLDAEPYDDEAVEGFRTSLATS